MIITLERTTFSDKETRGVMTVNDIVVGYTIEPPIPIYVNDNSVSAFPAGEYIIGIRNNPNAGVPCIKIFNKGFTSGVSIRCCKPMGVNNPSITLLTDAEGSGDAVKVDFGAWIKLLELIKDEINPTIVIK